MRALHQRVNIVPVLAKADTLTPSEVERKKSKVRGSWLAAAFTSFTLPYFKHE